ncbi:hypothetical protein SAMN05421688_2418 [Poseidonocella pacifica]|uniref:SseB protein N-terminal domain-containing protein n=1 Tax=Poseidonocella pacifica TaxID=871651 RepID=A0A1I0XM83_9RHOB|nr:SseB family protein [Poseidonocella pacifica]SFB01837.1 hypothetical protein SAMN05421688_2418 [Poseidonocella pacifica]
MTDETALDLAHAAMASDPDDDAVRLRFYERLADSELFLLLTEEPVGETLDPEVFPLETGPMVLAFDREDRLAQFAGRVAPYAALSGRVIVSMLTGQGVSLGVNLDVAPSATLLDPEAVGWLAGTLAHAPLEAELRAEALSAPGDVPQALLDGLDAKLATAAGLAQAACLASVSYGDGSNGHLLGFIGAQPGAEGALARAASEALTFSGIDQGAMDVAFFRAETSVAQKLLRVGLRFDLPEPARVERAALGAPGSDPDKPPRLR